MIRPTGDQVEYIDLSEPDSVVVYGQEDARPASRACWRGWRRSSPV